MMGKLNKKAIGMTALVVFLLLLTGALRLVNSENYLINIACGPLIFTIYISMLSIWIMSIQRRIMHSHIRGYLLGTAGLMLFWIFARTLKHAPFNHIEPVNRWLWYCFYISMILIPLLSFFIGLCLGKPVAVHQSKKTFPVSKSLSLLLCRRKALSERLGKLAVIVFGTKM